MMRPSSLCKIKGMTAALGLAATSVSLVHGATDSNNDGYDDVWQNRYGITVASHPLAEDADGDGATNQGESVAGTNPNDPLDVLKVGEVSASGGNFQVSVKTQTGKRYVLESSAAPNGPTWTAEGSPLTGTGVSQSFTVPLGSGTAPKFFRVIAGDQDTDGDGVSDWAEDQMTTSPTLANSPNNASGGVGTDGATLNSLLSISASVVTPSAYEKEGTAAVVRLSRSDSSMPLLVSFTVAGNSDATLGSASASDYVLKNGAGSTISGTSFTIPAGTAQYDVRVTPSTDTNNEVPEVLRLTFQSVSGGVTTPLGTAQVDIRDATNTEANRRLFVAYLGREGGAITTATGLATLMLNGDNTQATVNSTFGNLTSLQSASHLHAAPAADAQASGPIVESLELGQVTDHVYTIVPEPVGGWNTSQATLNALFNGYVYINVHTANYGSGEIRGNYALANGSVAEPPAPPAPPVYGSTGWPALTGSNLDRDIVRFLLQATYGPTAESIQEVKDLIAANGNDALAGYAAWINKQIDLGQTPSPSFTTLVQAADMEDFYLRGNKPINYNRDPQFGAGSFSWNGTAWVASTIHQNNYPNYANRRREWWTLVLQSKDQLRQRMALALSEIVVVSENDSTLQTNHYGMAHYWDMLSQGAFGRYRQILSNVSQSPVMAYYLSFLRNQKATGNIRPDENYAREVMQLFSIGLVQRHLDGSLKLDNNGLPIATYDQPDITELARVFTGFAFGKRYASVTAPTYPNPSSQTVGALQDNTNFFQSSTSARYWQAAWMNPLKMFDAYHDFGAKTLFNGKAGQVTIPARTNNTTPESEGLADITDALNALAGPLSGGTYNGHPNTPVFISRLLIQRFTTSNPSSGYLYRVSNVYKNTCGDLGEVIKAILLDYEARSLSIADGTVASGKVKEPLLHFTSMLRSLKCYTGLPLVNLTTVPIAFTSLESPVTTAYPVSEYNKFPAGALRFRFFDTQSSITQSPQRAPSVFNWFLPDYVMPGPLASAGLVAPELQVATESNVVNVVNGHYNTIFASVPPTANAGRNLDDLPNIAGYQTGTGVQLSIPQWAVDKGYFTATQFTPGTNSPGSLYKQVDNLIPKFDELITLYTNTYTTALAAQYAPAAVPATPGTTQKAAAHAEAVKVIVDFGDSLLAAGYLKSAYGSSSTSNPRKSIIDGVNLIAANNRHTTDATNFANDARTRVRNTFYLLATLPQAVVLK
ncbi:DUF1800 family protein [Verrucomicrobium sp. BvORR034]|uniref:DUF1800 family protein n=1 Tax=Verrucomicrobium sp. BvORR034 TaxID=1396418 RepID=UPI002241023A|nr:DUF1800 family protein [Verrucomicrobium sp. BvORR034]